MASGGRADRESRLRARAATVVIPFPRRVTGDRPDLVRLVPTGRSLLTAFAVLTLGLLAWLGARETGIFGVRTLDVQGGTPAVAAQVRRALAGTRGTSLLKIDLATAQQAVVSLPTIESVTFDRAFPHTLRVAVVPERPVAVARQGADSFLVSARGRVIARVDRHARKELARIWVQRDVQMAMGSLVTGDALTAVGAVAPLAGSRFPGRVTSVSTEAGSLTLRLRSGLEVRLGDPVDVPLKLAVAARVIPLLGQGTLYLDVSVPERPVGGTTLDSQVELKGLSSTAP